MRVAARLWPLVVMLAGCYSTSDLENGKLHCSASGQCPQSFSCVEDICWRGGIVVGTDMSAAVGDLAGGGGGDTDGGGNGGGGGTSADLSGVDLSCTSDAMCPVDYYCNTGAAMCVPQLSTDSACSADNQCGSGNCYMTKCTWVAVKWVQIAAFTYSPYANNALAFPFPDGRVIAFGGDGSTSTISAFNVTTRAVTTPAAMPVQRSTAGAALDPLGNRMWIFGGQTGVANNYISFDGTAWTPTTTYPAMPVSLFWQSCATLGSLIYCGGGTSGANPLATFQSFSPTGLSWTTMASLPYATENLGMATLGNSIYVAGGDDGNSNNFPNAAVYSAGAWKNIAPLNEKRNQLALVAGPDGRVYAVGGNDGDDTTTRALASVEAYSPALDRWITLTTTLNTPRYTYGLTRGAEGRLYAVGGFGGAAGSTRVTISEAYGPDVKLSTATPAAGATVMVTGNNFAPSARVKITFDGQLVATSTSDTLGGLNAVSFVVPNVPAGVHSVIVVDNRSGYPITPYLSIP